MTTALTSAVTSTAISPETSTVTSTVTLATVTPAVAPSVSVAGPLPLGRDAKGRNYFILATIFTTCERRECHLLYILNHSKTKLLSWSYIACHSSKG